MAKSWLSRIDSPAGISSFIGNISTVIANKGAAFVSGLIENGVDIGKDFLQINITPTTESRLDIQGPDDLRSDVSNGFVDRDLTHSVAFTDSTLNNADFFSVQIGSMATGGIRPGELQADPNVRPNQHLSQFYLDDPESQPDFSLRNAAVLNGLAAMTTVNTFVDPLLLDLNGQGAGVVGIESGVLFDVDNSGSLRRTGWADQQTGMLVHDDGSGQVTRISQMFSEYYGGQPGANGGSASLPFADGFAALNSVDANADGTITAADAIWAQLKVWVDANQNGRSDAGELKTLEDLGITSFNVAQVAAVAEVRQGNEVLSRGSFVINGVEREVLSVKFLADTVSNLVEKHGSGTLLTSSSGATSRRAYLGQNPAGETLDAAQLGVDSLNGGAGDDVLSAAPSGTWLAGGGGSNTYMGGAGDDVFVISASDQLGNIKGNGGRDTALIVGAKGVSLNMAEAGLTVAQGGRGNDVIASGGMRGVFIKGGAADSLLIGGGGNDVLVGGTGRNQIIGGSGKAVIYAGPKGDLIHASAGGSIIYAGGGADRIIGGIADDVIEAGQGNAIVDGGGGINVVSLHGNHDEYTITRTAAGYQVSDRVPGRDGTLTLSAIQKLSFADIASVDLQAPSAMPVGDTLSAAQVAALLVSETSITVPATTLLANDQLLGSTGPLRIASVSDGKGATVRLNAQGDVEVVPQPGHTGDISFRYDLLDAAGNASLGVVEIATGAIAPLRASVVLSNPHAPADPLASRQWYLSEINVQPVWRDFTGKGVRIGQFEPGGEFAVAHEIFDVHHPDLQANVDPVWLQTQRSNGTLPVLSSNHATQVAGVMVAARNDQGGIGIAHESTLGGHYLANKGDDLTGLSQMVGYDVVNHSWGFANDFALSNVQTGQINTELALALTTQTVASHGRGGLGTIMVTAGGNRREQGGSAQGSLINNSRYAIQVAAINAKADLSALQVASKPFSNPGASLLVSAPGSQVLSSSQVLQAERGATVGSAYSTTQGTSFAAPIVSGIAALMVQANPQLGYRDVQQILALSARKVDDAATQWAFNTARNWNGGAMRASQDYGFGLVDARAAVRLAESWVGQATTANETRLAASSDALAQSVEAGQGVTLSLTLPEGVQVEHVEVDIHAVVGRLGDVTLTLVSPGGTRSVLLDRAGKAPGSGDEDQGNPRSGDFKYGFMSTHHRGERSQGEWKLEVSNATGGMPLTLDRWSLRLAGSPVQANDVYFYTDEYAALSAEGAARTTLDDAVNGIAGGRNTLNAAAVSAVVVADLNTGVATIGGSALTITPGSVHNLLSGDGDDTLIAGAERALLDGGRGHNRLVGGEGQDLFVVHRRAGGSDVVENFDPAQEKVDLVGFAAVGFSGLQILADEQGVSVNLGDGQTLRFVGKTVADLQEGNFRFRQSAVAPAEYLDAQAQPGGESLDSTVVLGGGGDRVSLSSDESGRFVASLQGTLYVPVGAEPSMFVVARQEGADNYGNAVRGFRHGIDRIDLSQTGISSFEDLQIIKVERFKANGLVQIHGVDVVSAKLPGDQRKVKLLYLDSLEVAQVTREDFIFAQPAAVPPVAPDATDSNVLLQAAALTVVSLQSAPPPQTEVIPNLGNLIDAMAAFAPPASALSTQPDTTSQWLQSTLAVAA